MPWVVVALVCIAMGLVVWAMLCLARISREP